MSDDDLPHTRDAEAIVGPRGTDEGGAPDAIITHRFPLDDAPEAFRMASDRSTGAMRVVLEP